jgi:hypothetical protein
MSTQRKFLAEKVASHDLAVVVVTGSSRPHVLRAKVEHIYSCRKGITPENLGSEIEFFSGPESWGNVPLQVGERALLFVRNLSGMLNEYPWRGHMVLEEIGGELYALLQFPELWLREDLPMAMREVARQHPAKRNWSIIRFEVLEAYLKEVIEGAEHRKGSNE